MGIFATRARRGGPVVDPGTRGELSPAARLGLPRRFEAVAEALVPGSDLSETRVLDACTTVGRELARDGASIEETLDGLRETWRTVRRGDPAYPAVAALVVAWSEQTLGYLHQLSCEDPLTGLASLAHVRSRISELYRGQVRAGAPVTTTHALVICAVEPDPDHMTASLQLARLGDTVATVFGGPETIGRLRPGRVVVLTAREHRLGSRVRLLRELLAGTRMAVARPRVWIEGLPATDDAAAVLLDELAR